MSQINITITPDVDVSSPIAGQAAFFVSAPNQVGIKSSAGAVTYFAGAGGVDFETVTLSAGMIIAKQFTLAGTPQVGKGVLIVPKNGPPQVEGLDYTVSGQVISWNGLGLDGILEENDILAIYY